MERTFSDFYHYPRSWFYCYINVKTILKNKNLLSIAKILITILLIYYKMFISSFMTEYLFYNSWFIIEYFWLFFSKNK